MTCEDHLVYNLAVLGALVRSYRLAIVGDVIHSEATVKPNLPVTRIRAARQVESVRVKYGREQVDRPSTTEA